MKSITISNLGEREIIKHYISPLIQPFNESYKLDDCAIFPCSGTHNFLISTDQGPKKSFLEILRIGTPSDLGHLHVTMNVSDVAAMGGLPVCFVMSLSLPPDTTADFLNEYASGLKDAINEYNLKLIGGDTKEGDSLRNVITVIGESLGKVPLGRHLATPGQDVYVTGECGKILSNYIDVARSIKDGFEEVIIRPKARVQEGLYLARTGKCICCMDMSDGLFFSAEEIGKASEVTIALDFESLSIAVPKAGVNDVAVWNNFILNVGGDSDLMFTLNPEDERIAYTLRAIKVGKVLPVVDDRTGLDKYSLLSHDYIYQPWEHFKSCERISTNLRNFV